MHNEDKTAHIRGFATFRTERTVSLANIGTYGRAEGTCFYNLPLPVYRHHHYYRHIYEKTEPIERSFCPFVNAIFNWSLFSAAPAHYRLTLSV